jgi:hypothetical protein
MKLPEFPETDSKIPMNKGKTEGLVAITPRDFKAP